MRLPTFPVVLLALGVACAADRTGSDTLATGAEGSAPVASVHRPDVGVGGAESLEGALEELRRGLPEPAALEGGERDRDALVRRFVSALERRDTADLRAIVMTRAEFAYLYYPTSPYTRRPTRQAAPLVWFLHLQDSQKGVTRALSRHGGAPIGFAGYGCAPEPVISGENRLWHGCALRLASPAGDTTRLRLFGAIIERDGRFKLFSHANDL